MQFRHGNVEIAFLQEGRGEPIVLVHGFASNKEVNWVYPGWVSTLTRGGRRVIALDNRGHGRSTKLYDPADYHTDRMVEDVLALLDHLGLECVDLLGYSMGARVCAFLAAHHPGRARSLILGGLGIHLVEGVGLPESIAAALEAPRSEVTDPVGRQFRVFAEQTKSDRRALAACIRGARDPITREAIATLKVPVLVVTGSDDVIGGSAQELAALIPGAEALTVPRRDHMRTVGDRVYKDGVLDFLRRRP